jgi:uncharacterized RDD family membrane protein YckC
MGDISAGSNPEVTYAGFGRRAFSLVVDLAFTVASFTALSVTVAQWTEPEWSSLPNIEKMALIGSRDPTAGLVAVLGEVWMWSELVVLLLNEKRRAIHDYIAGTVVVVE